MIRKDNRKSKKLLLAGCLCMLVFLAVTSCKETTASRSLSEREFHYDDPLSALSLDGNGYWIGGENGIVWHVMGENRQRFYTGLDRIYDIERDPARTDFLWIASRNAGLQLWETAGDTLVHRFTFDIPCKGNRYSPYDIDIADSSLFVATSQGLYTMSLHRQQQGLKKLYPVCEDGAKQEGKPFLVNGLCHAGGNRIFAATQAGVVSFDRTSRKTDVYHKGENIRNVAVYGGKLYVLSGERLTIEEPDGMKQVSYPLPQPVLSFYKAGPTHYFITSSSILLSDNLKRFVSISLRSNIPDNPHRIAIPDDGKGFSILLTKNAVWRIPHHLGIFNANPPVIAACPAGNELIYVNNQHELFRQKADEQTAGKIYDFEDDDLPREMCAKGNDIYYYNANNQLCRLTLGRNYLINQLFARPQVLVQPKTRITSMELQSSRERILLGVQDYLLSVNLRNGRTDTVKAMNNRYITDFYQPRNSREIYIATLNDGVFAGDGNHVRRIAGTENKAFISSLSTYGRSGSHLLLLTNHQLQNLEADSVRADGCSRMFCISDSIVYAVPEAGLHKYKIRNGKIEDCGVYFDDIHFNAQAGFVHGHTLYIGSDLDVLRVENGREDTAGWVTFDNRVPSLQLVGIIIFTTVCIFCILLVSYRRRHQLEYRQIQVSKADLYRRLSALDTLRSRLTETERNSIDGIIREIDSISEQNLHTSNEQLAALSARITRMNRDAALQVVKYLNDQIERIRKFDTYECTALVKASEEARSTDDIEAIMEQCRRNDVWINHVQELKERLEKFRHATQDTLVLKGLNDGMEERIRQIADECRQRPIAEVYPDFIAVKAQYERIFTQEGLDVIRKYLTGCIERLRRLEGYEEMVNALLDELTSIEKDAGSRDRIVLLRNLQVTDSRIAQIRILKTLQRLMQDYRHTHDQVVQENEERRMKKFDSRLFADIETATRNITDRIADLSEVFFWKFNATDRTVCEDLFHFTTAGSQQVRVLILLLAMPRVKRTLLPGMLAMYGNLNPVVSRIYHNKIAVNRTALTEYCRKNPDSIVQYILKLSEQS